MKKKLVIYHANCHDGFCGAWVARKALGDSADYVAMNYGQIPKDHEIEGREVYVIDFSFPREILEWFKEISKFLVVLDHHKTAQQELEGLDYCIFDMERSGAKLAWDYFFQPAATPSIVYYVQDRDLWKWNLDGSREYSAWLHSYPMDFEVWDRIVSEDPSIAIDEGTAILRRDKILIDKICLTAREVEITEGVSALCANTSIFQSEVAGTLAKGRDFGAVWFMRADGIVQWSLRSTKDGIDVGEYAKQMGGGGHKHAAGFVTEGE